MNGFQQWKEGTLGYLFQADSVSENAWEGELWKIRILLTSFGFFFINR
jgi:hypothetical protein